MFLENLVEKEADNYRYYENWEPVDNSHIVVEFNNSRVVPKQDLSGYRQLVQIRFANFARLYNMIASSNPGYAKAINLTIPMCLSDKSDTPIAKQPALVFSKESYSNNILIPSYDQLMSLSLQFDTVDDNDIPFLNKESKCCFVSSLTNIYWNHRGIEHNERLKVCDLAAKNPDLFYAHISQPPGFNPQEWKSVCMDIMEFFPELYRSDVFVAEGHVRLPIKDQLFYKYLISVDGHTSAWSRLPWQMYSNSIPIKVRNRHHDFIEWFYPLLNKSKHLIETDIQDIIEIKRTLDRDKQLAQDIAEAGRSFVNEFLHQETAVKYLFSTLLRLSRLQGIYSDESKASVSYRD